MYAVTDSGEGDYYMSVPPDPGIEAAALGASASAAPGTGESAALGAGESALSGTAPTEALHTFTLDSGASRSFFRDSTTLTPLSRPFAVSLADPSGGPVLAHSSTVLPCPVAPSGLLSGLHLPSFSTNLVSGADLQDAWVDQFTPGGQRVTHCTCSRTGRHLATFTHRPGSRLYTLTTTSPPVTSSGQVAVSSQVFAATSRSSPASALCSCRPLSHKTHLWHHRLAHPSLPRLRGMASRTLVSGLPRSLPPLPPGPAPTCVPCVEGRQRAAPYSSTFPPTLAPLQTLHMDVWSPARIHGQGHERYFLLVVDDYSRYTTVFPLRRKGEVTEVLIDWIHGACRQLSKPFGSDLPVLRLHSDRGGEFSSDLLRAFYRAKGIRQSFTLLASPEQNGIVEHRIGMVMDVARTSMIHAAAPHFLWPFACSVSGDLERLSAIRQRTSCPPVPFPASSLASPLTYPGGSSTTPPRVVFCPLKTSRLTSRCLTTISFPTALPLPPPPTLFLAPGTFPVDPLPPQGPAPSGVSQVDPAEPVEVAVDSGAARGAEPAGAGTGGAEFGVSVSEGAEPGGAEPKRVQLGGSKSGSTEHGGAEPERAASGGASGVPSWREPLSPQQLREWYARRYRGAAGVVGAGGAAGAGVAGAAGAGGATGAAGGATSARSAGGASRAAGGAGAAGPGGARTGGNGAAGTGGAVAVGAVGAGAVATGGASRAGAAGGTGAGGTAGVEGTGAEGTGAVSAISGSAARPRPYYVPLLHQVLGLPPSPGLAPPLLSPPPDQSQSQFQPTSPLPGPSPYSGPTTGLTECREPESRPVSPKSCPASPESRSAVPVRTVRVGCHVLRQCPPPVSGTQSMTLRPSTTLERVPLPSPPASSLPDGPDPESDSLRAASPTVSRFLATSVIDPLFESTAASALVVELVDITAACCLDFATSLVAQSASESVCPPSVGGECALDTDVLEDRQEEFACFSAAVPHLVSMLLAPEGDLDAPDIPTCALMQRR
ncbi:unnamed protein product [Closterium sp. NIES-54]